MGQNSFLGKNIELLLQHFVTYPTYGLDDHILYYYQRFTSFDFLRYFQTFQLSIKHFFGSFSKVGGFSKTLHNFQGWSDEILTLPYKGMYMAEKNGKNTLT